MAAIRTMWPEAPGHRGPGNVETILGVDEAESARGEVSWISPVARALLKARVGDELKLVTPRGLETIEVLDVSYPEPGDPAG